MVERIISPCGMPGLDSMLSSASDRNALCAVAPIFSGTISA